MIVTVTLSHDEVINACVALLEARGYRVSGDPEIQIDPKTQDITFSAAIHSSPQHLEPSNYSPTKDKEVKRG